MNEKPQHIQGYAVIRIDNGPIDSPARVDEFLIDGTVQPTAGPSNVSVKQILLSADETRREVMRLNSLNADNGCKYYWQSTHVFLKGGSHGSVGRVQSEDE